MAQETATKNSVFLKEISLPGAEVVRKVLWAIIYFLIVVIFLIYFPKMWGCNFHWIGYGQGSWSMAGSGGVMPGSFYYIAPSSVYERGDVISFLYDHSADPSQNGLSIKRVVGRNSDGSYRVRGDNHSNSVPPCDVDVRKIEGKIVYGPICPLPQVFFRWLSMDWQLEQQEISKRFSLIFSLRTLVNALTVEGRSHNGIVFSTPPKKIGREVGPGWVDDSGRFWTEKEGIIRECGFIRMRISPIGKLFLVEFGTEGFVVLNPEGQILADNHSVVAEAEWTGDREVSYVCLENGPSGTIKF